MYAYNIYNLPALLGHVILSWYPYIAYAIEA